MAEGAERPEPCEGLSKGDVADASRGAGKTAARLAHRGPHDDSEEDAGKADDEEGLSPVERVC